MNHYEITTIAGLLNDSLNKDPDSTRMHPRSRVVRPGRVRRSFARRARRSD